MEKLKAFLRDYGPRIIVTIITALITFFISGAERGEGLEVNMEGSSSRSKEAAIKAIARSAKEKSFDTDKVRLAGNIKDLAYCAGDAAKAQAMASLSEIMETMDFENSKDQLLKMISEIARS